MWVIILSGLHNEGVSCKIDLEKWGQRDLVMISPTAEHALGSNNEGTDGFSVAGSPVDNGD